MSAAVVGCSWALACSPAHTAAPAVPVSSASDGPAAEAAEEGLVFPPVAAAEPAAPEVCNELAQPALSGAVAEDSGTCSLAALGAALSTPEERARDVRLAALEPCTLWPRGVIRALRAELAPAECSDVVTGDFLSSQVTKDAPDEITETLFALGLAGRLRRLAGEPPPPPEVHDKPTLQAYFQEELFPWIQDQSVAIHRLAERGAKLRGYARGVVAIEAGMADMRFVEIAREVPIPTEMREDPELQEVYYASLDEALEPRKHRGRDAALVGLVELGSAGVLGDSRLRSARALLSRVFGGKRIDALDRLLMPALPPLTEMEQQAMPAQAPLQIAAHAPTFYTPWLLAEEEATGELLRAYLERGLPTNVRLDLSSRSLDDSTALLLARAHIELGRAYFRAAEFAAARKVLEGRSDPEAAFLSALGMALMAGPQNAAEMIARGPRFADALGNLEALDEIAASSSPWAAHAGFNAAYLRELVAPAEDAEYWRDLAQRYQAAANRLTAVERREAQARAEAALATAKAIAQPKR